MGITETSQLGCPARRFHHGGIVTNPWGGGNNRNTKEGKSRLRSGVEKQFLAHGRGKGGRGLARDYASVGRIPNHSGGDNVVWPGTLKPFMPTNSGDEVCLFGLILHPGKFGHSKLGEYINEDQFPG